MKTKRNKNKKNTGFSLLELMVAMTIMLVLLGIASSLFARALNIRSRESRRTDALTSAQAALNVISREVANTGYGLQNNGLIAGDSGEKRVRFRANLDNTNSCTTERGEDVTYYFDALNQSIMRYERYAATPCGTDILTETSVVVNGISEVNFKYFDYVGSNSSPTQQTVPTLNTGRITLNVTVNLENVRDQPSNQKVSFTSDITLRNSVYMLNQY